METLKVPPWMMSGNDGWNMVREILTLSTTRLAVDTVPFEAISHTPVTPLLWSLE